jgi:hypothetical protein
MAVHRSLLAGLVLSAVVMTGPNAPADTAGTDTSPQTKSSAGPPVQLPDPTTDVDARANEESNAIAAIVSGMPGFGGIWVDEARITHVAVQHGTAEDFAHALRERPKDQHVLEEVNFSYNDLVARGNSISGQIGTLKAQGLDLLEWGPDEKNNAVWISLRNYTEEKADLAREVLGGDILVKPAAVAGDEDDLFSGTSG